MADQSQQSSSMRVAIAGASGLVGSALCAFLEERGHRVLRLVRQSTNDSAAVSPDEISWNPESGTIDAAALQGVDALIHLGGASIAKRWTAKHKARIHSSRVDSTRLLSETLARLEHGPRAFLCASAVGFYGDRGDEELTEQSASGGGFLANVCRAWEDATEPARNAGIRVVNLRLGMVLSAAGGALATMLPPFRIGLGGVLGSGRQYVSWISLHDVVRAIEFLLHSEIEGPANFTAPRPVDNRTFTKTLGHALGRPTIAPAPAFAIRLALGEMGKNLLLGSTRAIPAKLEQAGFRFAHPDLEAALQFELSR